MLSLILGIALVAVGCGSITDPNAGQSASSSDHIKLKGDDDNGAGGSETILEIAASNENFSILAQAVAFAGLEDAVSSKKQRTVFAPGNDACNTLLNGLGLTPEELLSEGNEELLRNILLYYVAPRKRLAEDVIDSDRFKTLQGKFIEVNADDDPVLVGNKENGFAKVATTDILASNGVIHAIDAVLLPRPSQNNNDDDDD